MTQRRDSSRIEFSKLFSKQLKKTPREIKIAFREALSLFLEDFNNPHLRNHSLTRKYAGHKSIDVTEDWRAIFVEIYDGSRGTTIRFKFIGTHSQLYKR